MDVIHDILFHLHVSEDLVVEAGTHTADLSLLLAAEVVGQVHHLFNLLLAVLAVTVVQLLLLLLLK